jgi:putative ABC transport system permease protein
VIHDLKTAFRGLARSPGFTTAAVVTLALGIGANCTIFSVVDGVLLRPLPYPEPERLVLLWERHNQLPEMMVSWPDYLDWKERNRVFEDLAVYNRYENVTLTGEGDPELLAAGRITGNLLRILGTRPALGRGFLPEEDRPGAERVAILGHALWQRRFAGDPGILGRTVVLDGRPHAVVGVMPPGHDFPRGNEIYLPLGAHVDERMLDRGNHPGLVGLGRLRPGVLLEAARADMDRVARALEAEHPLTNEGVGAQVFPLREMVVGEVRPVLLVLLGSVGFVLLIACANVANLLLARGARRRQEIAVRTALGAARPRLVRQLLTESCVLALAGGAAGTLLAFWGVDLLRGLAADRIPRITSVSVDGRVLLFTLTLSLLTGILFGAVPALQVSGAEPGALLRQGGAGPGGATRQRLRGALVVTQVALTLVLLVGAGLLARSFAKLQAVDPGFAAGGLMAARLTLPATRYPDDASLVGFCREAVARLGRLPGVAGAAAGSPAPFSRSGWQTGITIEGMPAPEARDQPLVDAMVATPGYFRTMAIPMLRGREFTERDQAPSPRVIVVNRAFARRFFGAEEAIGRRVLIGAPGDPGPWMEIVGVAGDVRRQDLQVVPRPMMHLPYAQAPGELRRLSLLIRTGLDPEAAAPAIRGVLRALDPDLPLHYLTPMTVLIGESVAPRRLTVLLLAFLAALALGIACLGIGAIMAFSVAQRTREFGIRMALGARRSDVLRMVVWQGLRLTTGGLALGLAGSLGLSRLLSGLLFGVTPTDPATYAVVATLLALVSLAACWIPARRATRVDPAVALRYE